MDQIRRVAAVVALVAAQQPLLAQTVSELVEGPVAEAIDEHLSRAAAFGWSGQVLVEHRGRLILHRAYGVADRSTGRPFTTTTPVGIASMSKMLTAAAILRLEEQGRLRLESRLGELLDGVPGDKREITLHQLLTHTAGLRERDVAGDFELDSVGELVRRILSQPLAAEPGARWRYSNSGYSLLAAVVESVSGVPYVDYVRREILRPAGMVNSGFWRDRWTEGTVAHAYFGTRDEGSPATWPANWRVYGAGDVVSTAADLYRFELALRNARILSAERVRAMRSVQVRIDEETGFGYAQFIGGTAGRSVTEHGGDWQRGYNGSFFRYVDEGHLVIVTSNARDQAGEWMRHDVGAILEALLRGEPLPERASIPSTTDLPLADRAELTGGWRLPDGSRVDLMNDGSYLWATAEGPMASELLAAADADAVAGCELAEARTAGLLGGLIAGRIEDSLSVALGADGAPYLPSYRAEWEAIVAASGPVRSFVSYGSVVARGRVKTTVRLLHADRATDFEIYWSDRGHGRLSGTFVRPPFYPPGSPVALVVRSRATDEFVLRDLFRDVTVDLRPVRNAEGEWLALEIGASRTKATPVGRAVFAAVSAVD